MYQLNIKITDVSEQIDGKVAKYSNVYLGPLHVARIRQKKDGYNVVIKNIGKDDVYVVEHEREAKELVQSLCAQFAESLYRTA